jgi:hypothetical protein
MSTVQERLKQLTSSILREALSFLGMSEQETNVVKIFDVKSFNYHDERSLREQYNDNFISFARHLNMGNLSFPRNSCSEICAGVNCTCFLDQYITFKKRVRDNKERFRNAWFLENEARQITWNTTNVLCYFQKFEHGLHEGIPDVVEIIEICLVMSRSQSDTERFGKLTKDVSEKRFGGKFNETHLGQNKRDRANQETFIYGNSVPLHLLPLKDLRKEWAKTHLPAILRTNPGKESSTLKSIRNEEQKVKFWFKNQ